MTETKRPDFAAYVVRDRDDKKANWRKIGVAFTHKDGKGFDLLLDSSPISRRKTARLLIFCAGSMPSKATPSSPSCKRLERMPNSSKHDS